MEKERRTCNVLKESRQQIADTNGITYALREGMSLTCPLTYQRHKRELVTILINQEPL